MNATNESTDALREHILSGLLDRFWQRVEKSEGCWRWTGALNNNGYGLFWVGAKWGGYKLAHRVSWIIHFGPIPIGKVVCHHCDNPPCPRPDHLFIGTDRDNIDDAIAKGRMIVPHGEKHHAAKLTADIVVEMRQLASEGRMSQRELARRYDVDHSTIKRVLNGTGWKHVPYPESGLQTHGIASDVGLTAQVSTRLAYPKSLVAVAPADFQGKISGEQTLSLDSVGQRTCGRKLTTVELAVIRQRHLVERVPQRTLALEYGVSRKLIARVVRQPESEDIAGVAEMQDRLLTVQEAARRACVTDHSVLHWLTEGKLDSIRFGSTETKKRWRIRPSDLERFLRERKALAAR